MSGALRKALRQYVVKRTKEIGPDVGGRVYPTAVLPRWGNENVTGKKEFPAILVYTRREDTEIWDVSPRSYKHSLRLAVEVIAQQNNELDDLLDDLTQGIETVFNEDRTLGMLCESVELSSTEMMLSADASNRVIGSALMTYDVIYLTYAVASGEVAPNLLAELQRINLDWRPAGSTADTPTKKDGLVFDS